MSDQWTPARQLALSVFEASDRARRSNDTSVEGRRIYWQTADWLLRNGYARLLTFDVLRLTKKGTEALNAQLEAKRKTA